jgi:uncharacterized RDD family membrane protein YckC
MHCSSCGAVVAEGTAFCRSCGRPIAGFNIAPSTAFSPAGSAIAASGIGAAQIPNYAGFWLRFVAAIIDGVILGIPTSILGFALFAGVFATALPELMHSQDPMPFFISILPRVLFFMALYVLASWLYWGLMESSTWQATLGKKALGLYVTDLTGNRVSFGNASGRFFAGRGISFVPSIGGLYYLVDCIMAGCTEKKQALHDVIASCLVMRNN